MLCYEDGMWKSFPHDEEYGDRWCFSLVLDMPRIPSKRLSPMEFVDMPRSKFPEPDTHRECTEGDLSYRPVKGGRNGKRRTARESNAARRCANIRSSIRMIWLISYR